ncbi:lysylphosphatidylglycerol synthase domain-containing protein [Streptomyces herbicida]|uniref:lysylphosphatidylglycerol synthase domain-containing protein n=1 Tax=Streptomyces herbicida TaxID=3065675 RepID=UPI0038CD69F5
MFAGNALSATLPGGSLVSITYRTRRMRARGASMPLICFTHAVTGVLSAVALIMLAGLGRTLAGDSAQLVGATVQASAACAVTAAGPTSADGLLEELAAMQPPARFWFLGLGAALINWVGDLVCVLAVCHAVGPALASEKVLLAYVAAMTAASALPLLPAGPGPLDAALVLTLHHGGMPMAAATAADLLYRTLNPGLIGVAGWSVLLVQRRSRSGRGRLRPQSPHRVGDPIHERGVEHGHLEDVAG